MSPFADGEFIKECLLIYSDIVCPENSDEIRKISLSRRTVTRRVEELSSDLKKQFISNCEEFQYFSVAVDESTDTKDTAQLAIFIRGINSNFDIC